MICFPSLSFGCIHEYHHNLVYKLSYSTVSAVWKTTDIHMILSQNISISSKHYISMSSPNSLVLFVLKIELIDLQLMWNTTSPSRGLVLVLSYTVTSTPDTTMKLSCKANNHHIMDDPIDRWVQKRRNASALAKELRLSCTKSLTSIYLPENTRAFTYKWL